jgi:hypothetical protein
MFKSVTSKFVGLGTTAVLISAIVASSASALNIRPVPVPPPCTPQISLASSGYLQGTCFRASDTIVIVAMASDQPGVLETAVASANGTFTVLPPYCGWGETESVQAWDDASGAAHSNTITIQQGPLPIEEPRG